MIKFNFAEWLKKDEMTTCASVGGGGSFTSDIAGFSRPVIGGPVRRSYPDEDRKKKKKKKKKH